MSSYLSDSVLVVDTNVASFIFKDDRRGDPFRKYMDNAGVLLVMAAQSRAELEFWALSRNWSTQRILKLRHYLDRTFLLAVVDAAICLRWAEVQAHAKRRGRAISVADSWIAATALELGAILVTHNRKDFSGIPGLELIPESPG